MKKSLISLAAASVVLAMVLSVPPVLAVDKVPCYCKFLSPPAGWFNDAAKKNCIGETVYQTDVAISVTMDAACSNACATGYPGTPGSFVATASEKASFGSYGIASDMMHDEKNQCPFWWGENPPSDIDGSFEYWKSQQASCGMPMNYEAGKKMPSSCTFCYCKYPASWTVKSCVGKTHMVRITSNSTNCSAICANSGLDSDGVAAANYNDKCDYAGDPCTPNAAQKDSPACASEAKATQTAQAAAAAELDKGSVVSLSLPLGDVKLTTVIGSVINRILSVVGAIAFLMFVYGGFSWMLAAGNEERIKHAKQVIVWATLGLVVIFAAYGIVRAILRLTSGADL